MADGFLGRWSQRKRDVAEGKPVAEPIPAAPLPAPSTAPLTEQLNPNVPGEQSHAQQDKAPAPTLADAQSLDSQSDYKPFMAKDVAPEVKNLAMKKLFTDPHFNIMDGLDIYIDDYSQPNPLPIEMMRKMTSAKFLNLFDDEDEEQPKALQPASSEVPQAQTAPTVTPALALDNPHHDHTDLRLQQDDAARAQSSERVSE